jgi:hypothetical protein
MQILPRDVLRLHGVATRREFEAGPGELTDALRKIGIGERRMKCAQRLAVNHQRDRDMVGTADAVEMVLDVAEDGDCRRRRSRRISWQTRIKPAACNFSRNGQSVRSTPRPMK